MTFCYNNSDISEYITKIINAELSITDIKFNSNEMLKYYIALDDDIGTNYFVGLENIFVKTSEQQAKRLFASYSLSNHKCFYQNSDYHYNSVINRIYIDTYMDVITFKFSLEYTNKILDFIKTYKHKTVEKKLINVNLYML